MSWFATDESSLWHLNTIAPPTALKYADLLSKWHFNQLILSKIV